MNKVKYMFPNWAEGQENLKQALLLGKTIYPEKIGKYGAPDTDGTCAPRSRNKMDGRKFRWVGRGRKRVRFNGM